MILVYIFQDDEDSEDDDDDVSDDYEETTLESYMLVFKLNNYQSILF